MLDDEKRDELAMLMTKSMGGHDGEINGRVAEAVSNLDEEKSLKSLRDELMNSLEKKPKQWFHRWGLGLAVISFSVAMIYLFSNIFYNPNAPTILATTGGNQIFNKIQIMHDPMVIGKEAAWLLDDEYYHPVNEEYPFSVVETEGEIRQNASNYIMSEYERTGFHPKDLLIIANQLDANNPWYLYRKVVDLEKAKLFSEAWNVLEQADTLGKIKDHSVDRQQRKLHAIADGREFDYISRIHFLAVSGGMSYTSTMEYMKVDDVFREKFDSLAQDGSKAEVEKWIGIYKRYYSNILEDSRSLVSLLVVKTGMNKYEKTIQAAANKVGLEEEIKKSQSLTKRLKEDTKRADEYAKGLKDERPQDHEFGILGQFLFVPVQTGRLSNNRERYSHVYDRNADHAYLSQHMAVIAAVLVAMAMFTVLSYFVFKGRLARFCGGILFKMLGVRDWVFIILGGVITPIAIYMLMNNSALFGARQWNILAARGLPFVVQFTGMVLLFIFMSYCITRWRISLRTSGLAKPVDKFSMISVGCILLAMLLAGYSGTNGFKAGWAAWVSTILLILPALRMGFRFLISYVNQANVIAIAGINRVMLVPLLIGVIVFVSMFPYFYAEEKKWVQNDPWLTLDPAILGLSADEQEEIVLFKEEIREQLELIR